MINSVAIENFKNLRQNPTRPGSASRSLLVLTAAANPAFCKRLTWRFVLTFQTIIPDSLFVDDLHCDWLYTRDGRGHLRISCGTDRGGVTVGVTSPNGPSSSPDSIGHGSWEFSVSPSRSGRTDVMPDCEPPGPFCTFLRLSASQLSKPSYTDRVPPKVEADGEGLASVLAYLALNDPDEFEQLVKRLRELIPHLKRIRFKKVPIRRQEKELVRFGDDAVERTSIRPYQGEAMLFDFEHAANVAAHTVSEGTLLMLGLSDGATRTRPSSTPAARRHRAGAASLVSEAAGRPCWARSCRHFRACRY
jgi:hypothetical protein